MTTSTRIVGVLAILAAFSFLNANCSPPDVCTLDSNGEEVDDCVDRETDAGDACTCDSDQNAPEPDANPDPNPEPTPEAAFRFVLIEDLTEVPSGDFPGADIDAIGLIKADGNEVFANAFEADTDVPCEGNLACDPASLLGTPDAIDGGNCFNSGAPDAATFTALAGGHAIVSFEGDSTIEDGDSIHVYEVGATECDGRFDDDPYRISVSVANDITGQFIEVGAGGGGNNIIPVTGLK